jgi:hypothetical protein
VLFNQITDKLPLFFTKTRLDANYRGLETMLEDLKKIKDAARILCAFKEKLAENIDRFDKARTVYNTVMALEVVDSFLMKVYVPVDLQQPDGGTLSTVNK